VARAEDVVQEAFLRLQLAADEGVVIESPKAYLATVATRLAIDHLRSAGVLQRANKLRRRVEFSTRGESASWSMAPFAETKELIAGYTLIQVKSREEALEWTASFPNPVIDGNECQIEVRQLYELEDFRPL